VHDCAAASCISSGMAVHDNDPKPIKSDEVRRERMCSPLVRGG
jgi:hypothetical protein